MWDKIKAFFKRSGTIFLARLEVFTGFIIGVISLIDWSTLANIDFEAGFTNNQLMWFAIGLVGKGIVSEIVRRRGTVETVNSTLVPKTLETKVKVKK